MSSTKIYGIMVIYNRCLKDSLAFKCLKSNKDIELIVCDNSTDASYNNSKEAKDCEAIYISMEGNKGLSCAYNAGLDYIYSREDGSKATCAVCFFDDDTLIENNYVDAVKMWLKDNSSRPIMLPIVRDEMGIMSPVIMKKNRCKRFTGIEEIKKSDPMQISGINSGMAVKLAVYDDYRYDENMFLDYIDHRFIMDMRIKGILPQISYVEIKQQFSAVTDDGKMAIKRFAMQKKDLKIFYGRDKLTYYRVVCRKHIKMAIKYRDFKMLFC